MSGQRKRWLDGITDSMDMNVGKLWEMVMDREAGHAAIHGVPKEVGTINRLNKSNKCFLWTPFQFTQRRMHLPINLISLKREPLNHHNNTEKRLNHIVVLCALGEGHQVPHTPRTEMTGGHGYQGGGGHRALPEAAHRPALLD